jgi:ATP-binding cassette, subfamily B, bacterial MsbA
LSTRSGPHQRRTFLRFWQFVRPHQYGLYLSILCFVLASATEPLVPALLKYALDNGFAQQTMWPIWVVPVALVVLFILRGVFFFGGTYLLNWAATRTVLDLRNALMRAIIRADASLYNELNPGIAISKVISNPQEITSLLGQAMTTLLREGLTSVVMLGYLFYLNWKLTLLTLVTLPLLAISIKLIHGRAKVLNSSVYEAQLHLVSAVDNITRAWRVVRTFDAGEWEQNRFYEASRKLQRVTLKSHATSAMMSPISQAIASIGLALILGIALVQVRHEGTSVGEFVAFITGMLLLISNIRRLTDLSQPIVNGLVTAQRCFEVLDTPAERDDGQLTLSNCEGRIEFEQVCLKYPGSPHWALDRITLSVQPGQTIAMVGASGAGKTTLVSALLGFVSPQQGRILLDGIDIHDLKKTALRKQFAVVSQDIVLFNGSLAENVAYAQSLDPTRLEQCLKAANLWDFVSQQPQSMNMTIGTNGNKLSGGQRQRLAIARALYKDAPVWIFDEATSALDSESERAVQQAIDSWQGRKTLILIAHRLSTIRNADCIFVMRDGAILESGGHEELLELNGSYAKMVRAQGLEMG